MPILSRRPKTVIVIEFKLVGRGINLCDEQDFLQGFKKVADGVVKALGEKEGIILTSTVYTK